MTVGENVEYGLRVSRVGRAERRTRTADALEMVRLAGFEERKPGSSPAGSANGWPWHVRSSTARASCCWTSRSAPST